MASISATPSSDARPGGRGNTAAVAPASGPARDVPAPAAPDGDGPAVIVSLSDAARTAIEAAATPSLLSTLARTIGMELLQFLDAAPAGAGEPGSPSPQDGEAEAVPVRGDAGPGRSADLPVTNQPVATARAVDEPAPPSDRDVQPTEATQAPPARAPMPLPSGTPVSVMHDDPSLAARLALIPFIDPAPVLPPRQQTALLRAYAAHEDDTECGRHCPAATVAQCQISPPAWCRLAASRAKLRQHA